MNEQRQQAYLELIQALLQCEGGTETDILQAHPELVDAGLVMTLRGVAQMLSRENDPERQSTIAWLTDFASQLAQGLGLNPETSTEIDLDAGFRSSAVEMLSFLMSVFQAIAESNGNPQVIYPLLKANLHHLNEELIPLIITWHQDKFAQVDEDGKQFLAAVVSGFANLIQQFPLGNRSVNLEIAIACYQLALEVYTRAAFPKQWAMTTMNLAVAYSDRIRGERAANLEESLSHYYSALQVRTRAADPEDWARTQMNLAVAYSDRIRGERAENIEEAIACYQLALEVYTRAAYPEQWAMTQNNLANAYRDRIRGERALNIEDAIASYQLALEVFTRAAFSEDWAMTQMNLAVAYSDRIRGERAENIEEAIACYQLALEVRTRAAYPEQWAMTHNNLATAYRGRIRGERAENIESAIACYQLALEVYTRAAYPADWATTQNNLANAYTNRIRGERAENIESAIACYQLALEVYTRAAFPERWAIAQENLAILYLEEGNDDLAIHHYQQALEIFLPTAFPINALNANRGLGSIYFRRGEWQEAIDVYDLAIESVETSRSWARDDESRQRIIREAISIYENVIQAYINLDRLDKAIVTSERSRSRQLVDLMATPDLYQDGEIPDEVRAYLAEYEFLERQIQSYRSVESEELISSDRSILSHSLDAVNANIEKIEKLEAEKQAIWQKIRQFDPTLAGQIRVVSIDFLAIQNLATNSHTAILSFYTTDDDTHIFIIIRDKEPQIHTCRGQGWQELQLWIQENWFVPYAVKRENWISIFPNLLGEIADRLQIDSLLEQLTDIEELIIIPHLLLHHIPFAALPISSGDLLGDRFTIHYAPSCQILKYCQDRSPIDRIRYGVIENTDGSLPGAMFECEEIARILNIPACDRSIGRQESTITRFKELLNSDRVTNLHLAHHAFSRLDNPLESSLLLADGNISLAQLILYRYPFLHEVFLSCCETALGQINITDDLLTIATGFLCAGARSVIGTLWAVNDLATPLLAIFYYQGRQMGLGRAKSLQMAQIRMRNLTGAEFRLDYRDDFESSLVAYIRSNRVDRDKLKQQFDRGEIDRSMFDLEYDRLTVAGGRALELIDVIDRYCEIDRPFTHPYYWAAFTCQGLA